MEGPLLLDDDTREEYRERMFEALDSGDKGALGALMDELDPEDQQDFILGEIKRMPPELRKQALKNMVADGTGMDFQSGLQPTDGEEWIDVPGVDARRIRLNAGGKVALEAQYAKFKEKFGREPAGDDPIFFNPDADEPEPMTAEQMEDFSAFYDAMNGADLREDVEAQMEEHGQVVRVGPKIGRNDPCPCGSGEKFKRCHG